MNNPKIGVIISTIREGRFGERAAQWIFDKASQRDDLHVEIVDLRDYPLPLFGEASDPRSDERLENVQRWKEKIAELDGYIFVTAEYNHSIPGVFKNALDYAYAEFNKKPATFVGYGGVGGARAVEQLRLIVIECQVASTRTAVHIGMGPYRAVTREGKSLSDFDFLDTSAETALDELSWWTHTLRAGRAGLESVPA